MPDTASKGAFRSLSVYNYRVWFTGGLISNIGTWMQRTAQDWIVLVELTHHSATAVGIVMSLQFGPQLLLLPITGWAADRFDRRTILLITQAVMGALALGLGLLTLSGHVQLWHVYLFAFALGCAAAFDTPARQSFVSEMVGETHISNAVALNSSSFNAARTIGPAIAGLMIAAIGSGWVFVINAASYAAVLCALGAMRLSELPKRERLGRTSGGLAGGFRYVLSRKDILLLIGTQLLVATFAFNFPVFISTMAVGAFHAGAEKFGFLTSMMAIGSVSGALLAARREKPTAPIIIFGIAMMGVTLLLAALSPTYLLFGLALMLTGLFGQTMSTGIIGYVQGATAPALRGRVIAIVMAVQMGTTPIGAPIVGRVADLFGPRWAIAVGAASALLAAAIAIYVQTRRPPAPNPHQAPA